MKWSCGLWFVMYVVGFSHYQKKHSLEMKSNAVAPEKSVTTLGNWSLCWDVSHAYPGHERYKCALRASQSDLLI